MITKAIPSVRTIHIGLQNTSRMAYTARFYGSSATPGQSSNVKNPISSGPESQAVNTSRGLEGRSSDAADRKSMQSPASRPNPLARASEAHTGEEETSTDEQIKNDPNKSPEAKRANVEKASQKPMGPEDRQ